MREETKKKRVHAEDAENAEKDIIMPQIKTTDRPRVRRAAWKRALAFLLVAGPIMALVVLLFTVFTRTGDGPSLFRAVQRGDGRTLADRMDAAETLAKRPDCADYVVKLLTDEQTLTHFPEDWPDEAKQGIRQFELSVTATLIENLPSDSQDKVLLAVIKKLSETKWGIYSTGGLILQAENQTAPIRDIAKATLTRCLGVDQGYDPNAWRAAIAARSGATTAPASSPASPRLTP